MCVCRVCRVSWQWGGKNCYKMACCHNSNQTKCAASLSRLGLPPDSCKPYCEVLAGTPVYMGAIHPRVKKPVGERLARAAMAVAYNNDQYPPSGPTVAGCSVDTSSTADGSTSLEVRFDASMMKGDSLVMQPYENNATAGILLSNMQVLTDPAFFCIEPLLRCRNHSVPKGKPCPKGPGSGPEWYCPDEASPSDYATDDSAPSDAAGAMWSWGGTPPANPYEHAWVTVPIKLKPSSRSSRSSRSSQSGRNGRHTTSDRSSASFSSTAAVVIADLSGLHLNSSTTVVGLRYAWNPTCCDLHDPLIYLSKPCTAANCPLMASPSGLPANPFMARVKAGECECVKPQVCSS